MLSRTILFCGCLASLLVLFMATRFKGPAAPQVSFATTESAEDQELVSVSVPADVPQERVGIGITVRAVIRNNTGYALPARIGRKSCGCVRAYLSKEVLPAHGELAVMFTITSSHSAEKKDARVWVNFSSPDNQIGSFAVPIDVSAEFVSSVETSWASVSQGVGNLVIRNCVASDIDVGLSGHGAEPMHVEIAPGKTVSVPVDIDRMSDSLRLEVDRGVERLFIPRPVSKEFANVQVVPRVLVLGQVFVDGEQVRSSRPAVITFSGRHITETEFEIVSMPDILSVPRWTETDTGKTLTFEVSDPRGVKKMNGILRLLLSRRSGESAPLAIPVVAVRK